MSNNNYYKGSRWVYYELGSISERDVKSWLTDYLTNEYRNLIDTRGEFILDESHLFEARFIPVIISGKKPKKRYHYSDKELARIIVNILEKGHFGSSEEATCEIEQILKKKNYEDAILGSYSHDNCSIDDFAYPTSESKPYITLYYNNYDCSTDEEFKVAISNCLAHEYFHFIHNQRCGDAFSGHRYGLAAKQRNAVTEALADFFSFVYTLYRGEDPSNDKDIYCKHAEFRFDQWKKRFGSNWPYAYAYCFFFNSKAWPTPYKRDYREYKENGCKEKFNKVVDASKLGMAEAYKCLDFHDESIDMFGID